MHFALRVLSALAFCALPLSANLVTNGSFETGDFTGWSELGNIPHTGVVNIAYGGIPGAEHGTNYAVFGSVGFDTVLEQSFLDVPGATYTFSFWLYAAGQDFSEFTALWDANTLTYIADPNTGSAWTKYSFSVVGTGGDIVRFYLRDDPSYIGLDNVSVEAANAPEPGSVGLLLSGLIAMGYRLRSPKTRRKS